MKAATATSSALGSEAGVDPGFGTTSGFLQAEQFARLPAK
jgi:hypothetical protein